MKAVEELSLVFMDSLDLTIEEGHWVYLHPVLLQQVFSKLGLVVLKRERGSQQDRESCRVSRLPLTQPDT